MTFALSDFSDRELTLEMERRGYVVRTATRTPLCWTRSHPFPDGLDFKAEALEKLRSSITLEHIDFEDRPVTPASDCSDVL